MEVGKLVFTADPGGLPHIRQTPLTCLSLTISCRSVGNAALSASISLQSRGATGGQSQQRRLATMATPCISGRWNTLSRREHSSELNLIHNQRECSPARFPFLSKYTNFSKVKCHYQYTSTKQPFAVSCYVIVYC